MRDCTAPTIMKRRMTRTEIKDVNAATSVNWNGHIVSRMSYGRWLRVSQ